MLTVDNLAYIIFLIYYHLDMLKLISTLQYRLLEGEGKRRVGRWWCRIWRECREVWRGERGL